MMPLYLKDDATAAFVVRLARSRGLSKQGAFKLAVEAKLKTDTEQASVKARLRTLWAENPLPSCTGKRAGKAFFDELSGQL